MKDNELNITSHVFLYNEFVHKMEKDYGHLDSWLNMEILNALALDEWEMSGKPQEWYVWKDRYQEKALNLVKIFFNESGLSCYQISVGASKSTQTSESKTITHSGYAVGLSSATAGMPIIPATGLGVVTDWYKDNGKYDISKTYSSNVLGNVVDKSLENSKFNTISPVVREFIINTYDRYYESKMGKR